MQTKTLKGYFHQDLNPGLTGPELMFYGSEPTEA